MGDATFDNYRATALRTLQAIAAHAQQLADFLQRLKTVRHDGYGEPPWYTAVRRAHDELLQAQRFACLKAEVRQGG